MQHLLKWDDLVVLSQKPLEASTADVGRGEGRGRRHDYLVHVAPVGGVGGADGGEGGRGQGTAGDIDLRLGGQQFFKST